MNPRTRGKWQGRAEPTKWVTAFGNADTQFSGVSVTLFEGSGSSSLIVHGFEDSPVALLRHRLGRAGRRTLSH